MALKAMATDGGMVLPGLLIALAVSALAWVALNRTVHGRQVPAIGQSQPAAQMSGIPVDGVRLATHVLCALLAALNGFLLSCFSGGAAHNIGSEYLLMSIAPEGRPPLREVPEMPATSPATPYLVEDARFLHLTVASARPECLATGCRWAEGPVWFADLGCLLFSDIPNQRILRWSADAAGGGGGVTVFRQPSNFANGQTRDREGRLVTCEHGGRRVTRTETDGTLTVLAERFEGRRLNSPNDVVVASDGAVWFTDPTYGILSDYEGFRAEPEQPVRGVYRLDPSGRLDRVADDFLQPNGLAFSPDEAVLYVADSGASHLPEAPRHILAFDVRDGRLRRPRVFATIDAGIPDGIRVDDEGNLWSSAGDGVHCFAPDGTRLGRILLPETVANLAFGGPRRNRLFLTATSSLYAIYLAVAGAGRP